MTSFGLTIFILGSSFVFCFLFLVVVVVLEFELRASHLLGRHSTA
jgi:Na+-transporting methylmalonyl-CoA/oxaloacetate decarboxylase gamma subunit